jgi:hypothetical protein
LLGALDIGALREATEGNRRKRARSFELSQQVRTHTVRQHDVTDDSVDLRQIYVCCCLDESTDNTL